MSKDPLEYLKHINDECVYRLIHDYMGINYTIVWDVLRNKIPELSAQIGEVMKKEGKTTRKN